MTPKLQLLGEEIVIGSHTFSERKFQVLNFMNMLYDNICHQDEVRCMTLDSVCHNLLYEIVQCERMSAIAFNGKSIIKDIKEELKSGHKLLALRDYHILLADLVKTYAMGHLIKSINY